MDSKELGEDEEGPPNSEDSEKKFDRFSDAPDDDSKIGPNSETTDFTYSLYICPYFDEIYGSFPNKLNRKDLEKIIIGLKPIGQWTVTNTSCGLIVSFSQQDDMLSVLKQRLSDDFKCPVQVAQFSSQDTKYRLSVIIKEVPWAIPLQELSEALNKQGIIATAIERIRQAVKVEISDAVQYENLLRNGFDFFGVARFPVIGGRCRFLPPNLIYSAESTVQCQDSVLQCYRCQGFWHIAANCRQAPRCVRCGESHSVEFCTRPRQNPICCHCSGPHHAAYKHCPVRQQLNHSTPVSLTLSTASRNTTKRTNIQT